MPEWIASSDLRHANRYDLRMQGTVGRRRGVAEGETGNLLALARRGWLILLLGLVIGGAVAFIVAKQLSPTYEASVSLLTGPINADFDAQRAEGNLARTYAGLATSGPVLRRTAEAANTALTPDQLRKEIDATSNDVTRLVTVRVRSSNPVLSARLANALGQELVALGMNKTDDRINAFMADPAVTRLPAADRARIRTAAAAAFAETSLGGLTTVDPAEVPKDPVAPRVTLLSLLGALAGLVVAALVVFIWDSMTGIAPRQAVARPD